MKYEIHVNQRAIIENGYDIDLTDGAIMDFCRFFSASSSCRFFVENSKRYYWFSHKNICEQLPILKLKPDSAYRRMKELCEKLFLEAHPENRKLNASWYTFGPLADSLFSTIGPKSEGSEINPKVVGNKSEPSDENPNPIGPKSEGPSDQNPMYKEIIDKEDNNKIPVVNTDALTNPSVEITGIGKIDKGNIALYVDRISDAIRLEFLSDNSGRQFANIPEFKRAIKDYQLAKNPPKQPMVKPTIEEVRAYATEKKFPLSEADRFFNYHDSKNWHVGLKPMEKWKSALAYWMSPKNPASVTSNRNPIASDQRRRANEIR